MLEKKEQRKELYNIALELVLITEFKDEFIYIRDTLKKTPNYKAEGG